MSYALYWFSDMTNSYDQKVILHKYFYVILRKNFRIFIHSLHFLDTDTDCLLRKWQRLVLKGWNFRCLFAFWFWLSKFYSNWPYMQKPLIVGRSSFVTNVTLHKNKHIELNKMQKLFMNKYFKMYVRGTILQSGEVNINGYWRYNNS